MDEDITRQQLLHRGYTVREIAAAVHRGELIRLRRGHYASANAPAAVQGAVRVGGRLACVSELRHRGVWVADGVDLHVYVGVGSSRHRDPVDRTVPLTPEAAVIRHWTPLHHEALATPGHVSLLDALAQSARCVDAWSWLAGVESALHLGLAGRDDLRVLREMVPGHLHGTLDRASSRSESGLETISRELCRALGFRVDQQVFFPRVGRVDQVVEGAVVVEVDGAAFHGAEVTTRDRRRDARLTALGFTPLHFRYAQVMFERDDMARAIVEAVRAHRSVRNSARKAQTALRRWETGRFC